PRRRWIPVVRSERIGENASRASTRMDRSRRGEPDQLSEHHDGTGYRRPELREGDARAGLRVHRRWRAVGPGTLEIHEARARRSERAAARNSVARRGGPFTFPSGTDLTFA